MIKAKHRDVEKELFWQKTIREAARSRMSIREFCRQQQLKGKRPVFPSSAILRLK